jgi:hypothetical protein
MMDAFRYSCGASTTFTFCPCFAPRGFEASIYPCSPGWHTPDEEHFSHALLAKIETFAILPVTSTTMPSSSIICHRKKSMEHETACVVYLASLQAPCPLHSSVFQVFLFALKSLYSILSTSACQLASITFSDTPTVPHLFLPSPDSIRTRTRAAVPSAAVKTRTL